MRRKPARRRGGPREGAMAAATAGGPTIATAGLATAVGFLVLLTSPVPMVRGFGGLLVVGIALALICAITAGFAALTRFGYASERPPRERRRFERLRPRFERLRERRAAIASHPRVESTKETIADRAWGALGYALNQPRRVLAVGLAVAIVGLALDTHSGVVSGVQEVVPQDLQALKDVSELQEETGVSGEIDVTVRADDITRPEVITWMTRFQDSVLKEHGYEAGKRCVQEKVPPELCPALSLPDIFSSLSGAGGQQQARALLDAVPEYYSQGVVSPDRKTANLAFGIRLMPLDRQKEVVDDIKGRLNPPEGVTASVVGLPVLAAEANGALASPWRRALTLLAALAGEFSVLLSSRYRQEREAGAGPARAIELTYATTGAAVLASGATAIAGFAALIASDIRMLRDFGIVTVVDLTVSLLGVMLVLPAALMWAEQHGAFTVRDLDPRRLRGLRPTRADVS